MGHLRVLIAGAGFAGFAAAKALHARQSEAEVTLVSPRPNAVLSPLVPGILSGWVCPWTPLISLREALPCANLRIGRLCHVNRNQGVVTIDGAGVRSGCEAAQIDYDALILATGRMPSTENVVGASQHALACKSPKDAVTIRNQIAGAFEAANAEDSARRRQALLSVAVVGNDIRACHIALELRALLSQSISQYPRVRPEDVSMVLIGSGVPTGVDSAMAERLQALLQRAGIDLQGGRVDEVSTDHLCLTDEQGETQRVEARTIVWAKNDTSALALQPIGMHGVRVDVMLRVSEEPRSEDSRLFALGDAASLDRPVDVLAAASTVANNVLAQARGGNLLQCNRSITKVLLGKRVGIGRLGPWLVGGSAGAWLATQTIRSLAPGVWDEFPPPLERLEPIPTHLHVTSPPPVVSTYPRA